MTPTRCYFNVNGPRMKPDGDDYDQSAVYDRLLHSRYFHSIRYQIRIYLSVYCVLAQSCRTTNQIPDRRKPIRNNIQYEENSCRFCLVKRVTLTYASWARISRPFDTCTNTHKMHSRTPSFFTQKQHIVYLNKKPSSWWGQAKRCAPLCAEQQSISLVPNNTPVFVHNAFHIGQWIQSGT